MNRRNKIELIRNFGVSQPRHTTSHDKRTYCDTNRGRIPKRMTFFWVGEKMSWLRYMSIYSFVKLNPDWEVDLVTSQNTNVVSWECHNVQDYMYNNRGDDYLPLLQQLNINILNYTLKHPYLNNSNWDNIAPPHKCDFLEWETLATKGGYFSDMDIIYLKPLDEFHNSLNESNIDTCICYHKIPEMKFHFFSIGFLCSSMCNPFYRDLLLNTFKVYDKRRYQSTGVLSMYSMLSDGKCHTRNLSFDNYMMKIDYINVIKKRYPSLKLYNIPFKTVYPWDWTKLQDIFIKEKSVELLDETIGIHWYGGAKISQQFNLVLNNNNYRNFNNTLCQCIIKYLDHLPEPKRKVE